METTNRQLQKECTSCHMVLPVTPENFSWGVRRKGDKIYRYPIAKCKSCLRKYDSIYREANRLKLRESERKYNLSPKGIYKKLVQSERSWKVLMTQQEFVEWYNSQPKKCYYCGIDEKMLRVIPDRYNNKTYRLTIDRTDSSKDYQIGNLVLCCLRCNHIKGDFFTQSEMEQIGLNFIALKWREYANNKTP